jgi:hypothetical protein
MDCQVANTDISSVESITLTGMVLQNTIFEGRVITRLQEKRKEYEENYKIIMQGTVGEIKIEIPKNALSIFNQFTIIIHMVFPAKGNGKEELKPTYKRRL